MKLHLFSEEDKALFIEGFQDGAPWTWTRQAFWYDSTLSSYDMGKTWANLMLEEMEETHEEENL